MLGRRIASLFHCLLLGGRLSSAQVGEQPRFDVPLDLVGAPDTGVVAMVEVRIDGQGPFHFAVDTGGQAEARLDRSVAERLGLPKVGTALGSDGSGKRVEMARVRIDRLELGGAVFANVEALVRDYPAAPGGVKRDGILCYGLFARGLLTLDYPGRRLRYQPGELPPADGKEVLALSRSRAVPQVEMDLAGSTVAADLDTGSMGGILLPGALMDRLPLAGPPAAGGSASTISQTMTLHAARLAGDAHLGREVLAHPEIGFLDGLKNANIGSQVLQHFAVTFDVANRRVRLVRPDADRVEKPAVPPAPAPPAPPV